MTDPFAPQSRRDARNAPSQQKAASSEPRVGLFAKNPRAWIAGAIGVAFLLLGTGAVFAGAAIGSGATPGTPGSSNSAAVDGRVVPAELPAVTRLRTCSIAALAADPRLATFTGAVMNATTGELLFDRSATAPVSQGSVLKVLTAAAALNILGPDYQYSTKVYEGSTAGTIVLVGGGDPTISQLPAGQESYYPGAPKLDDLAKAVVAAHPGEITSVVLDASMWSTGDKWDATWKRSEQTTGYLSEVTALQVDGDREDPTKATSPRSTDPVARAGDLFVEALENAGADIDPDDVTFSSGSAVTSKPVLGEVKSQPIKVLINQMLLNSDGTLAETMARVVSKTMGLGGSAASLQQAITSALAIYQVDTAGLVIKDGSGLSTSNGVPPKFMTQFMTKVFGGADQLNIIYDSLSVAGKTGSLASRFTGDNAVAQNNVFAKTGWLDTEYSLAGIINAADGTPLTFAFYANGTAIKDTAKAALDTLTTGAFNCGDNLSNN